MIFAYITTEILILLISGALAFYIMAVYPNPKTSLTVRGVACVSLFLSIASLLYLPVDIYNASKIVEQPNQEPNSTENFEFVMLQVTWWVIYWGNYVISRYILCFAYCYGHSGEFTIKWKLLDSFKEMLMYRLSLGLLFVLLLALYYFMYPKIDPNGDLMTFRDIISLSIAVSNCYGTFLIMVSLGFGMPKFSRLLVAWRNLDTRIYYNYFKIY